MSQTTCSQTGIDEAAYYSLVLNSIGREYATMCLLGGLYGVLAVLSLLSAHALTHKTRRKQPASIVLCLIILTLLTSTTTYLVVCVIDFQYEDAISLLVAHITPADFNKFSLVELDHVIEKYAKLYDCAGTSALTINVILGDAIVCWRATIIWEKNWIVKATCGVFLLATFVLGVIDTADTCIQHERIGQLYAGAPVGVAICVLSLSTNLLATLLVGYKAWQSRKRFKEYLVAGSQVGKLLVLLIESGAAYCAIWGAIVAYQVVQYQVDNPYYHESSREAAFIGIWTAISSGGLVPLVAIYPMIIIVLVALNRSQIEKGITPNLDSLPTPQLTVNSNPVVPSEGTSHPMPGALVLDSEGQESRLEDSQEDVDLEGMEHTPTHLTTVMQLTVPVSTTEPQLDLSVA